MSSAPADIAVAVCLSALVLVRLYRSASILVQVVASVRPPAREVIDASAADPPADAAVLHLEDAPDLLAAVSVRDVGTVPRLEFDFYLRSWQFPLFS